MMVSYDHNDRNKRRHIKGRVSCESPFFSYCTFPALAVPKRSLALRAARSTVDVLAPVRIPGLCAGAVGGLPPAGLATAAPFNKESTAVATVVDIAAVVAVCASLAASTCDGDAKRWLLVVAVSMAAAKTDADGVGAAILWSRNPLAASLTCSQNGGQRKGRESGEIPRKVDGRTAEATPCQIDPTGRRTKAQLRTEPEKGMSIGEICFVFSESQRTEDKA